MVYFARFDRHSYYSTYLKLLNEIFVKTIRVIISVRIFRSNEEGKALIIVFQYAIKGPRADL